MTETRDKVGFNLIRNCFLYLFDQNEKKRRKKKGKRKKELNTLFNTSVLDKIFPLIPSTLNSIFNRLKGD